MVHYVIFNQILQRCLIMIRNKLIKQTYFFRTISYLEITTNKLKSFTFLKCGIIISVVSTCVRTIAKHGGQQSAGKIGCRQKKGNILATTKCTCTCVHQNVYIISDLHLLSWYCLRMSTNVKKYVYKNGVGPASVFINKIIW